MPFPKLSHTAIFINLRGIIPPSAETADLLFIQDCLHMRHA